LHNDLDQVRSLLEQILSHFGGAGNVRINFVGGEPLLVKSFPKIIDVAVDLGFEVSIVTNGSALTDTFIRNYASKISMIGLSVDSFVKKSNIGIGRTTKSGKPFEPEKTLQKINLARTVNPNLLIKVNTVVCELNFSENMSSWMNLLAPDKWKIFRVLPEGDKRELLIDDQEFSQFVRLHTESVSTQIFVEDNDAMTESYIMIDPLGRFMQNSGHNGSRMFSDPILSRGVESAFSQIKFSRRKYDDRYIAITDLSVASNASSLTAEDIYGEAV
ncbi:viperin family antiviral radical SAM protein, partial [bacterium]|nr:viperin family antiviral radical SAM protein [bacterium]